MVSMVAPLAITPITKMKVVAELILSHLIANFYNLILKLDQINPRNMKVASI